MEEAADGPELERRLELIEATIDPVATYGTNEARRLPRPATSRKSHDSPIAVRTRRRDAGCHRRRAAATHCHRLG